jgi:Glycerophosphoryl diester phosphodiesterase family
VLAQALVRRRTLLAAGLGAAVASASGCSVPSPFNPTPTPTPDELSVRSLTQTAPFFLGSRGGARDWPEMTLYSYQQAATVPKILAMEISVCGTSDGVLVCSADTTTERMTGQDMTIAQQTWQTLSSLRVRSDQTRDPSQPDQPLARFDDIVEAFIDRFVFFVEPTNKKGIPNLLAQLISLDRPEHIVWKQPINSARFGEARRHGFGTLGYVLDEPAHTGSNLRRLAASDDIEMLGVSLGRRAALLDDVLQVAGQHRKQAVAWNVQNRADLERATKLGFQGIGSPAIREIVGMTLYR